MDSEVQVVDGVVAVEQPVSRGRRRVWLLVGAVVAVPLVALVALWALMIGPSGVQNYLAERGPVQTMNASLDAVASVLADVEGPVEVVHHFPAEARWFVCCGDSGPSGWIGARSDLPVDQTAAAVRAALVADGWQVRDDMFGMVAGKGELQVTVSVFEIDAPAYDEEFPVGSTQVAVTTR